MKVRALHHDDWPAVARIYAEGIATGLATFESKVPEWHDWDSAHLMDCRLIAEEEGDVLGWAALSPVSGRCVYGGVAEVSVYVAASARGRGVGSALLEELIRESEQAGLWTLQAGIFPDNEPSIAVHVKHGFREVGVRHRIGRLNGQWRDVALLERRSGVVGAE